jgi:hypothetical protein
VAIAYAAIGLFLLVDDNFEDQSLLFPDFSTNDVNLIGIFMLTCCVGQILFMWVVWRGFRYKIDILYWLKNSKKTKILKLTLGAIFIQIFFAGIVLDIVLVLNKK